MWVKISIIVVSNETKVSSYFKLNLKKYCLFNIYNEKDFVVVWEWRFISQEYAFLLHKIFNLFEDSYNQHRKPNNQYVIKRFDCLNLSLIRGNSGLNELDLCF